MWPVLTCVPIPNLFPYFKPPPKVVFSHPPIGTIGLTEEEAVKEHGQDKLKIYKSTFVNLFYGPWQMEPSEKPKTAMKLICLGPEERVSAVVYSSACSIQAYNFPLFFSQCN